MYMDKVIKALPGIFSISVQSDYQKFVPKESVEDAMKHRWEALGERLYVAFETFEVEVNGKETDKKEK